MTVVPYQHNAYDTFQPRPLSSRMFCLSAVKQQAGPLALSSIKAPPARPPTLPINGADGTSYSVPMHQALIAKCLKSKHPNHYNSHKHTSDDYFLLTK
jgi:hypothetical protein